MKTDKLIEQIKAAQKEHLECFECFDKFGNWIPGRDVSPLEEMADEMAERILADAEALKAADEKLAKIHAVSMAYAEWVGEVSEILEEMCLDPEDDDHARVIQLLCQAEAGLAKEALVAYNAKFGERE